MPTRHTTAALAVALAATVLAVGDAGAQRVAGHAGPGGEFGLGAVVGQPTGLSAELGLGGAGALHFALGFDLLEDDDLYFHLVYKAYLAELVSGNPRLPLYVGAGGFVARDADVFGLRAPLGVALDFPTAPIHVFVEIALLIALVEDTDADVGAAVGFHYFF